MNYGMKYARTKNHTWFVRRYVYNAYGTAPPNVAGQDEAGRLWDIIPSS